MREENEIGKNENGSEYKYMMYIAVICAKLLLGGQIGGVHTSKRSIEDGVRKRESRSNHKRSRICIVL